MTAEQAGETTIQDDLAAIARMDVVPMILNVVCQSTGMGFAAVARVTESRWVACSVRDDIDFGLRPGGELKVETTICDEIRDSRQPVVIDDVREDPRYRDHATPSMYGFQSYISMPIFRLDGAFFGSLCAIDPRPAALNNSRVLGMFKLFADLIGFHLDAQERMTRSEAALLDERRVGELREQFIAVLGHDLRNPLASIDAGAAVLQRMALDGKAQSVVSRMQRSVRRMARLIDDVLDFARGRMGSGLALGRRADPSLAAELEQVVEELRAAYPGRLIDAHIALSGPVCCDGTRIGQMLSNLLANALAHGAADQPVQVRVSDRDGMFTLSVSNAGAPLPPATMQRLFQPFFRARSDSGQQGLGLGLYIVQEIARAHGGVMDVASTPRQTCFTFRMPAGGVDPLP